MVTSRAGVATSAACRSVVAVLLLTMCLGGCSADGPPSAPTPSSPASSSTTPGASPSGGTSGWNADGPSFGVNRAAWPRTVKEAERVLQALPGTLNGSPREIVRPPGETGEYGETGPSAGATFGDRVSLSIFEEFTTTDTEDGEPATMSADDLLAATFLMVMSCAEASYQGTARPAEGGLGPAVTGTPGKGPVWFSCRVEGAEGDEDFTAHVVGWTSGKTAWQALAPDEASLRSLVTALHTALG